MSQRSRLAARGWDEFLFSWSTCLWGKEDENCRLSWVYNFSWQLKGVTERSWHGVRHTACKISRRVTCRARDSGAGVTGCCWPMNEFTLENPVSLNFAPNWNHMETSAIIASRERKLYQPWEISYFQLCLSATNFSILVQLLQRS